MPVNNLYKMVINTLTIAAQRLLNYCQTNKQTINKQRKFTNCNSCIYQSNKFVINKKTNDANVKTYLWNILVASTNLILIRPFN